MHYEELKTNQGTFHGFGVFCYNRSMSIDSLTDLDKTLRTSNLLAKYGLRQLGVFGSFARGEQANDIDFYVEIEPYDTSQLIDLKKDLEAISGRNADIMLKQYANPIILYRAQKDMKYVGG